MGRQIRFIIWAQRGSYCRFYNVRGKLALKQTEYPVCGDYTSDTGSVLNTTRFLK